MVKLRDADIANIRQLAAEGISYADIGRRFNVTPENASMIAKRKTWKHIA